jgi:asparagine synthase (glutamine-hydrolysing)
MLLGNGVEGRFPFLDHRVIELACSLPDAFKLRVLVEKYLLRRFAAALLPSSLARRTKQPYRAPVVGALVGPVAPEWARRALSREAVDAVGIFSGEKVERLAERAATTIGNETESDAMALMAIASTQLLHDTILQMRPVSNAEIRSVEVNVL